MRVLHAMVVLLLVGSTAHADSLIAYTSFEEPFVPLAVSINGLPSTSYKDPGNPATDHALVNQGGENIPVNHTSVGGELGYSAYYTNTLNNVGLSDGDSVGVIQDHPTLTSAILDPTDGIQQYVLSDVDGKVTVTLDSVDLTGLVDPRVSLDYWFRSTSWLATDFARIWLEIDNGQSVSDLTLLDTRPNDIDALGLEGFWSSASAALPSGTIATLKFELQSTDPSRMVGIDNVRFTAATVPEPSTLSLAAVMLSVFAVAQRRRIASYLAL